MLNDSPIYFSTRKWTEFSYDKIQEDILSYLVIDLIGILEYFCFSSISINAKFFGKINSEIYLKNLNLLKRNL